LTRSNSSRNAASLPGCGSKRTIKWKDKPWFQLTSMPRGISGLRPVASQKIRSTRH